MAVQTRFETGISSNNLKHWGMLEVLKEFIQNAVYAHTVLGDEINIEFIGEDESNGIAIIKNSPSGFSKGKLLIGESEQADVAGAPGQYGEGMKAAMAVAKRCGNECAVMTNGFIVRPELEPSALDPEVNSLIFYIEDNDLEDFGTEFRVQCSKKDLENAKKFFAVLDGVDYELVKHDTILKDYEDCVYINGVLITEMPSTFGYNFTNPELMNRDRTSINQAKLIAEVRNIMLYLKSSSVIEDLLQDIVSGEDKLEAQVPMSFYYPESMSAWQSAAKRVFGTKVAMACGSDADTLAKFKKFKVLTTVPNNWKWFFSNVLKIKFTSELEELQEKPKNKHVKPDADENGNLGWAKRLIKLYYGNYGTVRVSERVVDEFGNDCLGLYVPKDDITWLKRSILSSKELTFKTLLHETIHRLTGAQDNTEHFTNEWEEACWRILNRGRV